ncbi:MAG: class I SAM-dependent RNA methyltransferase [FCB group bacterium]|nr:class I SAM-dependent RNA methyltransferase [FCB group bacterium]
MEIKLKITDFNSDGGGVGRDENGRVTMVLGAVPGDIVTVAIGQVSKGVAFGTVLEIIEPSEFRVDHPCPYYNEGCAGSMLGGFDHEEGLKWKQKHLRETLKRIGGIDDPKIDETVAAPDRYGYRDRVELQIFTSDDGIRTGYVGPGGLVPVSRCLLASEAVSGGLSNFLKVAANFDGGLPDGHFRLLLKDNGKGGCLGILFSEKITPGSDIIELLDKCGLAGWQIRITGRMDLRFNRSWVAAKNGDTVMLRKIGDKEIELPPTVFTQANGKMEKLLHERVFSEFEDDKKVLDLYGGFGAMGLSYVLRKGGRSVIVESSFDAVKAGRDFAKQENLKVKFHGIDLSKSSLAEFRTIEADYAILDPPRKGADKNVIDFLNNGKFRKIIYVSCHPAALARDLKRLSAYSAISFTPFDMFPNTPELETAAVLEPAN